MPQNSGLNYTIKTSGDFAALEKFKREVKSVKKDLTEVRKMRAASKAVRKESSKSAAVKAQKAERKLTDIQKERLRIKKQIKLTDSATVRADRIKLSSAKRLESLDKSRAMSRNAKIVAQEKGLRLQKQMASIEARGAALNNKDLQDAKAKLSIERQIASAKAKQSKFTALAAVARKQGLTGNQQGLADLGFSKARAQSFGLLENTKGATSRLDAIKKSMNGLNSAASKLTGGLRRLFTALVFFAISRKIVEGIRSLISSMISFNSQLEKSKLGIASLILATSIITNAQGKMVEGAEALAVAQKIATQQTSELRKEALKTAATFEDLVFAFQTGLAPGLAAGLGVDQVRKFTVRISQAAAAIGLAQNQLAEEIRSLLQGTITPRTTRIATSLGITNEDIRRVKETGTLFEFLEEKFSAFGTAAEEAMNTFDALFTNLKDAIQLAAGAGGLEFFESVKKLLKDIKGEVVEVSSITGAMVPTASAQRAFKNLGDTLSRIAESFREVFVGDDLGAFEGTLNAIAKTLEAVSQIVLGIVDAAKLIGMIVSPLVKLLGSSSVFRTLGLLGAVVAAIGLLPWGLISATVSFLSSAAFSSAIVAMKGAFASMAASAGPILLVPGALVGVLATVGGILIALAAAAVLIKKDFDMLKDIKDEMSEIEGETVSWGDTFKTVFVSIGTDLKILVQKVVRFFASTGFMIKRLSAKFKIIFLKVVKAVVSESLSLIFAGFEKLVAKFPRIAKKLGLTKDSFKSGFGGAFLDVLDDSVAEAEAGLVSLKAKQDAYNESVERTINLLNQQAINDLKDVGGKRGGKAAPRPLDTGVSGAGTAAALKAFELGVPGGSTGRPVNKVSDSVKTLTEDVKRLNAELELTSQNLPSETLRVRKLQLESGIKLSKEVLVIEKELAAIEIAKITRAKALEAALSKMTKRQKEAVKALAEGGGAEALSGLPDAQKMDVASLAARMLTFRNENNAELEKTRLLQADLNSLTEKSNELLNVKIRTFAEEVRLKNEMAAAESLISAERTKLQARQAVGGIITDETAAAEELRLQMELSRLRVKDLARQVSAAGTLTNERVRLNAQLIAEHENLVLINTELEKAVAIAEDGEEALTLGFIDSWNKWIEELPDRYTTASELTSAALNGITSNIAGSLTDALDPNKDGAAIKDRWRKFFKDIADQILKKIIGNAIAKVLSSLSSGDGTVSASRFVLSENATGGYIKGYASGGQVDGVHLAAPNRDPRDTVPAWLRPGEFVLQPDAVRSLGVGFLEKLNGLKGSIGDLTGLSGLSSLKTASKIRRTPIRSFATGGPVTADSASTGDQGGSVLPVMVADESSFEKLLANGRSSFRNALRENQDVLNTADSRSARERF